MQRGAVGTGRSAGIFVAFERRTID